MTFEVRCPAKINLFLSVGPLDSAGYHPIKTTFQAISLSETLQISRAKENSFECASPEVPAENTVTKAWRLAKEYVGFPELAVRLEKAGLTQGGLGLGSSNAAGFLRALIYITKGNFSMKEAYEVACAVGSDVPFFLVGGTANAEGYGELLTPLADAELMHLVIAKPSVGVDTVGAYKRLDSTTRCLSEFPASACECSNDFELVMPDESADLIAELNRFGATCAHLCGSGSSVFGCFESQVAAQMAQTELIKMPGVISEVTTSLTRAESLQVLEVE